MENGSVSVAAYWRLVRNNRNFRLLWSAQIVSEIGDWLYAVAVYSLLLEYTGSAKAVALAVVLQVLPQFFVAPAVGVLNDRISRKQVMILADWLRAAIVLCMLLVRTPDLVWFLYVLLVLQTFCWAMFEPGRNAVIPNITKGKDILVANSLSSATWSFNLAVGASIGGLVAVLFGRDAVFIVNGISFVVSALILRRMAFNEPHLDHLPPLKVKDLADFSPILEGVRYVSQDRRLFATLFVKCGLGLTAANLVLLPIFGERIFPVTLEGLDANRAGMLGMSLLMGCRGVGAILAPLVSSYWAGMCEKRLRLGILLGFLMGAAGYFALSGSQNLAQACLAVVITHMGGSTIWIFSTTLLQARTKDCFRGRVFSAEFAFAMLSQSSVNYTAGVLVDRGIGPRSVATLSGALILLPALAWTLALRTLWRREEAVRAAGADD